MALSDLRTELLKQEFHLDTSSETKLLQALLESIKDSNSEVANMAVKWYGY